MVQVTGQLEHPSIVPVHELGIDAKGRPFYTKKLLKGRTLQAVLETLKKEGGRGETTTAWPLNRLLNAFAREPLRDRARTPPAGARGDPPEHG